MNTEERKTKLLIYDVMFKAVFNRESNVLLKMMMDIFDIKSEIELAQDTFVFSGLESVPNTKEGKTYRGDMTIRLSDKSYIMIEMNYRKDQSVLDRNMLHLTRVHNQILKRGITDSELKKYRIRGVNLNNFYNDANIPIEKFALCSIDTNKISSLIYSFCNVSLVKCKELVYDINVINLPNAVRWGAILLEEDIDKISQLLGDDMLSMEEKENFLKTIENVNNDEVIMQEWILEENERLKHEGQMAYAREEGLKQGIEQGTEKNKKEIIINMLNLNIDYNVISKVTGKSIETIKEIECTLKAGKAYHIQKENGVRTEILVQEESCTEVTGE